MKLSKLQKHYLRTFKKIKKHLQPGVAPMYVKLTERDLLIEPTKSTKLFAKYLGQQILLAAGLTPNQTYSLRTEAPQTIDVICTINYIPCLIVFVNQELHAIHMGYDPVQDTFDDKVVLQNGITVLSSSVREIHVHPNNSFLQFNITSHPMYGKQELDTVLNELVQEYNITEEEIPEELQFQLDTIAPNTQYYFPVYQRALHIKRNMNSLKAIGKKPSVLQILRFSAGI